jgi:two-component SAPR family response regulator
VDQRWLASRSDGYQLRVDPDDVDVLRFRRLVNDAGRGERSDAERVQRLDEALALWRGTALDQLTGNWAENTRTM